VRGDWGRRISNIQPDNHVGRQVDLGVVGTMTKCCGTCKFWVPEKEGLVERARAKNPWPHCSITGDTKTEEDKPCMVWMPKK